MPGINVLGKYDRKELGRILSENKVHFVLYPSINNETFSYVAQELMMLEVPFVVFPCGAPKERIIKMNYKLARIAEHVSVESLYEAMRELVRDVYNVQLSQNTTFNGMRKGQTNAATDATHALRIVNYIAAETSAKQGENTHSLSVVPFRSWRGHRVMWYIKKTLKALIPYGVLRIWQRIRYGF